MRLTLGTIGKLGDELTKNRILELSKDNPKILEEYNKWLRMANITKEDILKMDADIELNLTENSAEEISELIPKGFGQKLSCDAWDKHTPYENKLELIDGEALCGDEQRDRMIMALVYNTGLEYFIKLLPAESMKILKTLL